MPGLDGYTATRLIREWETAEGRARRPIVMLSADDLERQRRMGGAVGCSGYLSKPANREQLLHALAYYAGGDRAAARLPRPNEGQTLLV
jgi:CheY-like chemotaxis protein